MNTIRPILLAGLALCPAAAIAQPFAITNYALPCGGNTTPAAAGPYTLTATIGDPLAAPPGSAGPYSVGTGFIFESAGAPPACYANCDSSTASPVLNVGDFTCFLQKYASADPYANCDGSTAVPVLNVGDFTCFLQKYAAGCP
jgi:hypothetical protein